MVVGNDLKYYKVKGVSIDLVINTTSFKSPNVLIKLFKYNVMNNVKVFDEKSRIIVFLLG